MNNGQFRLTLNVALKGFKEESAEWEDAGTKIPAETHESHNFGFFSPTISTFSSHNFDLIWGKKSQQSHFFIFIIYKLVEMGFHIEHLF